MKWTLIDKAEYVFELQFYDGVIFENPAWVNEERTGFIYHCAEGGFGCVVYPDDDDRIDGVWSPDISTVFERAKNLINFIENENLP